MKFGRVGALAGLVVAAGIGIAVALQPSQGELAAQSPLVGRQAPALQGESLIGAVPTAARLAGHYVVVNFFASWCSDCDLEAPQLSAFHSSAGPGGVEMVMVDSFDGAKQPALSFLRQTGVSWSSIFDPNDVMALDWGVRAPPETFVVSPKGEVIAKFVGPVTATQLESVVG